MKRQRQREAYKLLAKAMKHGSWEIGEMTLFNSSVLMCHFDNKTIELDFCGIKMRNEYRIKSFKILKEKEVATLKTQEVNLSLYEYFVITKAGFFARKLIKDKKRVKNIIKEQKMKSSLKKIFN